MMSLIKNLTTTLRYSKKGNNTWVWIVITLIVAAAVLGAMLIYTQSQTHPFWEVE